jgi:hypothetical protein
MTRAAFVGRERELGALAGWLADARAGATRLAPCGGKPGVGKTRLAEELTMIARAQGVPSVWGRAVEVEGAPPYWLWRQVLRGTSEVADVAQIVEKLGVARDLAMPAPDVFCGGCAASSWRSWREISASCGLRRASRPPSPSVPAGCPRRAASCSAWRRS